MNNKIYLLTQGCYSDYRAVAAFTSLEKLQEFERTFPVHQSTDYNAPLEMFLDPLKNHVARGYKPFRVTMSYLSGDCRRVEIPSEVFFDLGSVYLWGNNFSADIMARDTKHAIKIVNEKRIQHKATAV